MHKHLRSALLSPVRETVHAAAGGAPNLPQARATASQACSTASQTFLQATHCPRDLHSIDNGARFGTPLEPGRLSDPRGTHLLRYISGFQSHVVVLPPTELSSRP